MLCGLILLIVCVVAVTASHKEHFLSIIAPYGLASQDKWWERNPSFGYPAYSYWEDFTAEQTKPKIIEESTTAHDDPIMQYVPDSPSPVELHNNQPYHLLNDSMQPPRLQESVSCVNSRSCYATDFQRMIEKTGNFRQLTNNYKRDYPDSCTSPIQELVLNFYKHDPMPIPANNTGSTVSSTSL